MIRNALFASMIALGALGSAAQAADAGPRLVNQGGTQEVAYGEQSRNVIGGASASLTGGGDDLQITYGPRVTTEADVGLAARVENVNGELQVVYGPAASSGTMMAGRTDQPRG